MLDIKFIRENPDIVKENIKKKFQDEKLPLVDEVIELDSQRRANIQEADQLRSDRNRLSKQVGMLMGQAKKDPSKLAEAEAVKKQVTDEAERLAALEKLEAELDEKVHHIMLQIPQIIDPSVPIGPDDSANVEVQRFGEAKVPDFPIPPFMIHGNVVEGVMSQTDMDAMMYKIEGEDLYLIGTSEHSMIGRFIDQIIPSDKLPQTLTSYSPCFRKEKGSHGIEERGVYRIHQFEKQEMIVVCKPEDSKAWYDKLWNFSVERH